MKFEKITNKKIKITLSLYDLELNNISINTVFSDLNFSEKLLQSLLDLAQKEIGFETEDSKLLVEIIFLSDKTCTFTITKLIEKDLILRDNFDYFIFEFDNFENFIDLCYFIKNMNNLELSTISNNFSLTLYNNTYYLQVIDIYSFHTLLDYIKIIFSEFGKNVSSNPNLNGILNEYGMKIFENNAFLQCINKF